MVMMKKVPIKNRHQQLKNPKINLHKMQKMNPSHNPKKTPTSNPTSPTSAKNRTTPNQVPNKTPNKKTPKTSASPPKKATDPAYQIVNKSICNIKNHGNNNKVNANITKPIINPRLILISTRISPHLRPLRTNRIHAHQTHQKEPSQTRR